MPKMIIDDKYVHHIIFIFFYDIILLPKLISESCNVVIFL